MKLTHFKDINFLPAIKALFKELNVPMNYVADEPTTAKEILKDTYKENETFQLVDDVYFVGMVDDAAFEGNQSLETDKIKSDYDGILIFGITLNQRPNNLLPTRSQLAEISRAFNREFYYTPVVLVFKYKDGQKEYLAFANTERLKYKQEWREGEKAGKVSLLRDIDIQKPHAGHERIIAELQIPRTGRKAVDSFAKLYNYWQEVFSVSLLNKKFYKELSDWYFWARDEVTFPDQPLRIDYGSDESFYEAMSEHNGKNLIRLLTRVLFVWFVKEKGLVPAEIFDEKYISDKLLDDFEPQKPQGFFAQGKHTSRYYRAILQNLFFATLNCEKDKREFRKEGSHQNTTHLMRYKDYFKGPEIFLELMESSVPFMNGGLFDCLDKPHHEKKGKQGGDIIIYQDGFSDRDDNPLSVPDYLFFDREEQVDLSKAYGQAKYKKVNTRGLLKILDSYKFTITENTPVEEDVALDPELLGRVFENLLASYNPETKTTARKQTGSFYTPREIVNFMVDESLIAYLKNAVDQNLWDGSTDEIDSRLHELVAYDNQAEFETSVELKSALIKAIDNCKILDPACGSGAFPMGVLQKMVHILYKIDPNNNEWKQRQLDKIDAAINNLDEIEDAEFRDKSIKELKSQKKDIEQAFEKNDLDYGRKLYLIENCIYGVDIQSIAVQISKLRFFISLIVDQYVDKSKGNFGIRPLPNLETKFVAANTLVGINKKNSLFDNDEVEVLEGQIKLLNKKLFSIKTPSRKRELRYEIKVIRDQMALILEDEGLDNKSARQLANWDPFDQNASSPFFDPEWMFDVKAFDVVIGNPPYHQLSKDKSAEPTYKEYLKNKYQTSAGRLNLFIFFTHEAINLAKGSNGIVSYIIPNTILTQDYYSDTRKKILKDTRLIKLVDYDDMPFENAVVENVTFILSNTRVSGNKVEVIQDDLIKKQIIGQIDQDQFLKQRNFSFNIHSNEVVDTILSNKKHRKLSSLCDVNQGIALKGDKSLSLKNGNPNGEYYRLLDGRNINKYKIEWDGVFLDYDLERIHSCKRKDIFKSHEKLFFRRVSKNLIFTYDNSQFFALNTLIVVNKKNDCKDSLKALLAIFNSEILNYIYQKQFKSTKKVFSEIQARSVKELPIPTIPANVDSLLALLSDILMIKQGNSEVFNSVSNAMVDELYFPDHMKERKIDVFEFVERDMQKVLHGREFDNLDDTEKEKVIEQLHTTWSHPDNEVRNRMKLFAVRSPEILKPILESK